jgi:hypothetical protein
MVIAVVKLFETRAALAMRRVTRSAGVQTDRLCSVEFPCI